MEDTIRLATLDKLYYDRRDLCSTLSSNSCPLITVTNFPPSDVPGEVSGAEKEYVVLSSRVHPGETNSSWIMKGNGAY